MKVPPPGEDRPPWENLDGWRSRLAAATNVDAKRSAVAAWAEAAGATANGGGFVLPPGLRRGLALAELRSAAQRCGLAVEPVP